MAKQLEECEEGKDLPFTAGLSGAEIRTCRGKAIARMRGVAFSRSIVRTPAITCGGLGRAIRCLRFRQTNPSDIPTERPITTSIALAWNPPKHNPNPAAKTINGHHAAQLLSVAIATSRGGMTSW